MCNDSGETEEVIILTRISSLHDILKLIQSFLQLIKIGTKQMNYLKLSEERKIGGRYLFRSSSPQNIQSDHTASLSNKGIFKCTLKT